MGSSGDALGSGLLLVGDGGVELLIQPNVVQLKWSIVRGKPPKRYPGFTQMQEILQGSIQEIRDRVSDFPDFCATNIRYENLIFTNGHPTGESLADYFKAVACPPILTSPSTSLLHELNFCWRQKDQVDQRIRVLALPDLADDSGGLLVRCTTGRTLEEPSPYPADWIETNHRLALELFLEIITEKAKEEWGYGDSAS